MKKLFPIKLFFSINRDKNNSSSLKKLLTKINKC